MPVYQYDKVTHAPSGRTAVAMRHEETSKFGDRPRVVWVAWDDAASYPRFVRTEELTVTGKGSKEDLVVYAPDKPDHGKQIRDLPTKPVR